MKILFLGTPQFAATVLDSLCASDNHTVVGVVAQPDRAVKRGKVEVGAVAEYAVKNGLKLIQPTRIRDNLDEVRAFNADIAVTAAYGQILDSDFIGSFPNGVINVHASLLPKYRGASPIYAAILNGEHETGVTIMKTELGLDTGDILSAAVVPIEENDTKTTLETKLAKVGGELLIQTLDGYNKISPQKQDDTKATVCKTVKKQFEYIDFFRPCDTVCNQIRALADKPCAKTIINGEVYKIYFAKPVNIDYNCGVGVVVESGKRLVISCAKGAIEVTEIQASGKRRLKIDEFLRGNKIDAGAVCEKR